MKTVIRNIALAGALVVGTAAASMAQNAAPTLGELVNQGQLTLPAVEQLIAGTGITLDEAMGVTVNDVVEIKWEDS